MKDSQRRAMWAKRKASGKLVYANKYGEMCGHSKCTHPTAYRTRWSKDHTTCGICGVKIK